MRRPILHIAQILQWADECYERTGKYPRRDSGRVQWALGEKWINIDAALRVGLRGLPGGSSLALLLQEHRGVRNRKNLPPYTLKQLDAWIRAWRERTGTWPDLRSGPIPEAPGETWNAVEAALSLGLRGMPGGSSLRRLLQARFGVRNPANLPRYTLRQIDRWICAHRRRTGDWPRATSGPIPEAPGETWLAVDMALRNGSRGMPGGCSLAQLLEKRHGVRNARRPPPYTIRGILQWVDAVHARTGLWPTIRSGPIIDAPGETWVAVNNALKDGNRGLKGGSSLPRLLAKYRGVRNIQDLPPLTTRQIRAWAAAWKKRHGHLPTSKSGSIPEAPGETWNTIDLALSRGTRGHPGGSSLARLIQEHFGVGRHVRK
ncbi:MAG: hypothetical protein ACRDJ9_22175, partial [Dehalococcoidia bacterium]